MEKIKEIYDAVIAYCTANPVHAVIVIALLVFILAVAIVMIVFAAKNAKAKTSDALENVEEITQEKTVLLSSETVEINAEELNEETKEREKRPLSAKQEEPVEEIQPVPAPIVEKTSQKEKDETPKQEESEKKETKKEEPIKHSEMQEKENVKQHIERETMNKTNTISKEGTMLHDELKDVDTNLDFYEEDETDRVARYSGKWVICRVVTNDAQDEQTYFFELHASNGEKLLSSEEYTTYNGAIRGIETHKSNILRGNFRITLSKKGDYIFKLLNGKNMLLCMGEHYATKARCESAIESAKRFARTAFVDENVQDVVVKVPTEDDSPIEPVHENYNGKWVIDCKTSPEGDKVFFFELFANNGERLLSSEEYSTYIGAVNGIQTHKTNIKSGNFRISLTKQGDYIYKLLNGNGQLLCLGEHYKTKTRCQNAVESVKRFAANSPILADPELTKE